VIVRYRHLIQKVMYEGELPNVQNYDDFVRSVNELMMVISILLEKKAKGEFIVSEVMEECRTFKLSFILYVCNS
jgi:hypothetical protein